MNYQIISDEDELRRFIDWLPDLGENEIYYLALFTRKKYLVDVGGHPWIKSDKNHLKRFTSTKERLFDKIRQLECPLGSYVVRGKGDTTFTIPQETLVLYITPNPRDLWKATIRGAIDLMRVVECQGKNSNPHQEILSTIQRTCSRKEVITFDLDEKNPEILAKFQEICGTALDVVETRGGYHCLVHPKEMPKHGNWYMTLKSLKGIDQVGDNMLPVPGCMQGLFTPKMIINNH
jgi:hypothetical protein